MDGGWEDDMDRRLYEGEFMEEGSDAAPTELLGR